MAVDRLALTIDVNKGPKQKDSHPGSVFAHTHIPSDAMEESLDRIAEAVLGEGGTTPGSGVAYPVACHLLAARPPRLKSGPFKRKDGETAVQFAVRAVSDLEPRPGTRTATASLPIRRRQRRHRSLRRKTQTSLYGQVVRSSAFKRSVGLGRLKAELRT